MKDQATYAENEDYAMIVAGKDGWLYRTRLDLKSRFKLTERTLESYGRLNESLKRNGTDLVIAMMPTRGIARADMLLPPYSESYDHEAATRNYYAMLDEFREAGLTVADMSGAENQKDFFRGGDNHWNFQGAEFTAKAVAKSVKQLESYKDVPKMEFETILREEEARPPNRFVDFVNQHCQTAYPEYKIPSFPVTLPKQNQGKDQADELFADTPKPEIALIGTSNSRSNEPSYANFGGYLQHELGADIMNEAVSGGSLEGSISSYLLSGKYKQDKPKIMIWEMSAYYGFNRQEFLRELIPAIHGECADEDALEKSSGDVAVLTTTLFRGLQAKNYKGHNYYLVLKLSDEAQRKVRLRFNHGRKSDSIDLERPLRAFPKNPGIYFAELSDVMEEPLDSLDLELKSGAGQYTAKICKSPYRDEDNSRAEQKAAPVAAAQEKPGLLDRIVDKIEAVHVKSNIEISAEAKTRNVPQLVLPDISGYTREALLAKIPATVPGKIEIGNMEGQPPLRKFAFDKRLVEFQNIQDRVEPEAIHIRSGIYNFTDLVGELKNNVVLEETADAYVLRLPLAIYPEAGLIINKLSKPLHLSQDRGAFLVTAGKLFIVDTTVVGWNEKTGAPAELNKDMRNFRPFITTWDGSQLYIQNSKFANMGYALSKSYGLSISTNEVVQEEFEQQFGELAPPTGWILDSAFDNMYFGFYSYEAVDVALLRNTYRDNLIYGIDPHDRSERLIIGYNKVTGSKKKHGIILSREVNNSFVFNNHLAHNKGSGIMLDRNCENTLVVDNVATQNNGDGITIYESPNNVLANNKVIRNDGAGIRIRNSHDIYVTGGENRLNKNFGLVVYEDPLTHTGRDFKLDPVVTKSSADVDGMMLENNLGIVKANGFRTITLRNLDIGNASIAKTSFGGQLVDFQEQIAQHMTENKVTVINNTAAHD